MSGLTAGTARSDQGLLGSESKTLVIGLGNPIIGDDGVGWRIAEQVSIRLQRQPAINGPVMVERLSVGGLALMERLVGCRRAILIDAITIGESDAGDLLCVSLNALPDRSAGHLDSAHDASLQTAMEVGRSMGYQLPREVWVVGVRARQVREFSDRLSWPVAAAVQPATEKVLGLLANGTKASKP